VQAREDLLNREHQAVSEVCKNSTHASIHAQDSYEIPYRIQEQAYFPWPDDFVYRKLVGRYQPVGWKNDTVKWKVVGGIHSVIDYERAEDLLNEVA